MLCTHVTVVLDKSGGNRSNIRVQRKRTRVTAYRPRDTGLELAQTGVSENNAKL